jgi:endonuclease YncB( thermonuclease family)
MRHRLPFVIALVAAAVAAQEFSWTDGAGKERRTKDRKAVPSDDWKAVRATARGAKAISGERFQIAEGAVVVLEGIQAPEVTPDGSLLSHGGEAARARLDELIRDQDVGLEWEGDRLLLDAFLCHALNADGKLLAEILLEEGLVRLCLEDSAMRHADVLKAAQFRAQEKKAGLWSRPAAEVPPDASYYLGVGLGLYAQDADYDYGGFLKEIKEFGATHVLISTSWLMEDWRSNEIFPVKGRSASFACIERTTRQARELGLQVVYLPLVLLRTGVVEHWRGDIDPTRLWLWFRNYGRYIARFADFSRELGASLLSAGSEFTSLERHTGAWKVVIANLRTRCPTKLAYSANWDHLKVIKFWNDLDVAGMTAYFSLTRKNDPSVAELVEGWKDWRDRLLEMREEIDLPIFFTEVGYPSQDGANKDPWNYFINVDHPDYDEQADCFRAFTQSWNDAPPEFRGFFIWNWWRNGDMADPKGTDRVSYSIYGKPAYDVMKDWYAAKKLRLK